MFGTTDRTTFCVVLAVVLMTVAVNIIAITMPVDDSVRGIQLYVTGVGAGITIAIVAIPTPGLLRRWRAGRRSR